jgi:hypothetical protein
MVRNGEYVEKRSHCAHFVFYKLPDKKLLMLSLDSPTYVRVYVYTHIYTYIYIYIYIYVYIYIISIKSG